ncbi:cysteine--tRNA ligase [Clostridium sp. D2Q-14]|uniref:cysteine--tRNA ligase n=1 Tax=Anaeromonas gelatinilytica TaxID=2683194 RepID=UPI00193BE345|nr:cysteine--tRNA ligase [Anaeromonas gelatinilytica]MBS4534019.1 cysteine--tRNA ligase [Anaeromonas gelatinilytica]
MKLYNTLTRKKEEFIPLKKDEVTMYVCGPTVYNYIHIGNARPLIIFDVLRRYLKSKGYNVKYLVNFTDIDDKMINKALEENTTVKKIADKFIEEYYEDAKNLNLLEGETIHPRATENIEEIIQFIKTLENKGYAYSINGDVYFDISRLDDYGKLSNKNIEELESGARIGINAEKKNPIDFTLWKNKKEGEPAWKSPWGEGRPGWHIECSVMARRYLGDTIDIHAGGHDLEFPHHENEIAQSESFTGKRFANYWLHNAMINVEDIKMSKSKANFFTVRGVSEEYDLEVVRYFILSSHYRSPINFSREILNQSKNGLERLYNGKNHLKYILEDSKEKELNERDNEIIKDIEEYKNKFIEKMEDDLNTADALSVIFELIKYSNTNLNKDVSKKVVEITYNNLMELSNILGLLYKGEEILEEEILNLIQKRIDARANKDYALADEIRDSLKARGIILEDTKEGTKWKKEI